MMKNFYRPFAPTRRFSLLFCRFFTDLPPLPGDSFAMPLACAWADKWVEKKAAGAGSLFLGSPCYPAAGNGVRAKVYSSDSSAAMLTGILAGTI